MKPVRVVALIFCVFATIPAAVGEGWDYQLATGVRTVPWGGAVFAEAGYGWLLWDKRKSTGDFLYGYLRPTVRIQTSGVVTQTGGALEFFPISVLGLSAGSLAGMRFTDTSTIDCSTAECHGFLSRHFVRAKLTAGYGGAFLTGTSRLTWVASSNTAIPFTEEGSALIGAPGGDRLLQHEANFGYKLDLRSGASLLLGGTLSVDQMLLQGTSNQSEQAFLGYKTGPWLGLISAGAYRSSTLPQSFTASFYLQWTGVPSLAL
jgi:hypothetical protein